MSRFRAISHEQSSVRTSSPNGQDDLLDHSNSGRTKLWNEDLIATVFQQAFDQPNLEEGYIDDNTELPYRYLDQWYLFQRKDAIDASGTNSNLESIWTPLCALPDDQIMNNGQYVLRGWLRPAASSDPHQHHEPILVQITDMQYWCVDRTKTCRGYWVETTTALYWLRDPSSKQGHVKVKVTGAFAANDNRYSNLLKATFPSPASQEDLHWLPRARMGLLSNLLDVFSDKEADRICNIGYTDKTPEELHHDLKTGSEEPYDLELLRSENNFVYTHLSGMFEPMNLLECNFLRALAELNSKRIWTTADYIESVRNAERRSNYTSAVQTGVNIAPSPSVRENDEVLEMRLQQVLQKLLQNLEGAPSTDVSMEDDDNDDELDPSRRRRGSKRREKDDKRPAPAKKTPKRRLKRAVIDDDADDDEDVEASPQTSGAKKQRQSEREVSHVPTKVLKLKQPRPTNSTPSVASVKSEKKTVGTVQKKAVSKPKTGVAEFGSAQQAPSASSKPSVAKKSPGLSAYLPSQVGGTATSRTARCPSNTQETSVATRPLLQRSAGHEYNASNNAAASTLASSAPIPKKATAGTNETGTAAGSSVPNQPSAANKRMAALLQKAKQRHNVADALPSTTSFASIDSQFFPGTATGPGNTHVPGWSGGSSVLGAAVSQSSLSTSSHVPLQTGNFQEFSPFEVVNTSDQATGQYLTVTDGSNVMGGLHATVSTTVSTRKRPSWDGFPERPKNVRPLARPKPPSTNLTSSLNDNRKESRQPTAQATWGESMQAGYRGPVRSQHHATTFSKSNSNDQAWGQREPPPRRVSQTSNVLHHTERRGVPQYGQETHTQRTAQGFGRDGSAHDGGRHVSSVRQTSATGTRENQRGTSWEPQRADFELRSREASQSDRYYDEGSNSVSLGQGTIRNQGPGVGAQPNDTAGQGRGRGISNKPAWMTKQNGPQT